MSAILQIKSNDQKQTAMGAHNVHLDFVVHNLKCVHCWTFVVEHKASLDLIVLKSSGHFIVKCLHKVHINRPI